MAREGRGEGIGEERGSVASWLLGGWTPLRTPSPTVFAIRVRIARQMAGWKTKNNNSSTSESELWRNVGPSAFQLQVTMLKSDKI